MEFNYTIKKNNLLIGEKKIKIVEENLYKKISVDKIEKNIRKTSNIVLSKDSRIVSIFESLKIKSDIIYESEYVRDNHIYIDAKNNKYFYLKNDIFTSDIVEIYLPKFVKKYKNPLTLDFNSDCIFNYICQFKGNNKFNICYPDDLFNIYNLEDDILIFSENFKTKTIIERV